mgnify:CR=1 FL=1
MAGLVPAIHVFEFISLPRQTVVPAQAGTHTPQSL